MNYKIKNNIYIYICINGSNIRKILTFGNKVNSPSDEIFISFSGKVSSCDLSGTVGDILCLLYVMLLKTLLINPTLHIVIENPKSNEQ